MVPIVGKGTADDPKRPQYAPLAREMNPQIHNGMLAVHWVKSDDGKMALVEFVASDRKAFQTILADPAVKAFLRDKDKQEDVEAEFKKHKKDFDFEQFGANVR